MQREDLSGLTTEPRRERRVQGGEQQSLERGTYTAHPANSCGVPRAWFNLGLSIEHSTVHKSAGAQAEVERESFLAVIQSSMNMNVGRQEWFKPTLLPHINSLRA